MIGISSYNRGNHSGAQRHLERVIPGDPTNHSGSPIRFQFDQQLVARAFLAIILWLQGFPKQATRMAEDTVERARAADHANSLCQALARAACPIALWVGDFELAERNIGLLRDCSTRHALTAWHAYDRAYQGMLLIRRGDLLGGIALLRAGFKDLDAAFSSYGLCMFIGELAEALGHIGQIGEALATVDEAIERSDRAEEGWIMPELLRVKGELLRLDESPGALDSAEACFLQALQLAGTQGALAWELRAATSVARLHGVRNRSAQALACLRPIYDRFTEGFGTADLFSAKQLLDELSDAGRR
jgi:tetratricopeptide (TPR) repeat protein